MTITLLYYLQLRQIERRVAAFFFANVFFVRAEENCFFLIADRAGVIKSWKERSCASLKGFATAVFTGPQIIACSVRESRHDRVRLERERDFEIAETIDQPRVKRSRDNTSGPHYDSMCACGMYFIRFCEELINTNNQIRIVNRHTRDI